LPSPERILAILDEAAEAFVFPMLDNGYSYLAASRLSCFSGDTGWAFVFEIFGYSPRTGVPDLFITTIGEGLIKRETRSDFVSDEAFESFEANNQNWRQDSFYPIEGDEWIDHDIMEVIRADVQSLSLRGQKVPAPSLEHLKELDEIGEIGEPLHLSNVTRAIAQNHRSNVLATESERRIRIPDEWTQLLCLDEWNHPDLVNPDCKPSTSATMRCLADVIATGDPGRYKAENPNTHWRNWPEGGTL